MYLFPLFYFVLFLLSTSLRNTHICFYPHMSSHLLGVLQYLRLFLYNLDTAYSLKHSNNFVNLNNSDRLGNVNILLILFYMLRRLQLYSLLPDNSRFFMILTNLLRLYKYSKKCIPEVLYMGILIFTAHLPFLSFFL